jgi:MFS family permease
MSDITAPASAPDAFATLDDSKITRFQLKIMFISGMGFFTDAYDLFVIGIVVALLKTEWHLSTGEVSWLNSATLLASAVGALVFGRIADILGRKRIYGYEVLILAIGPWPPHSPRASSSCWSAASSSASASAVTTRFPRRS